jgi:hypothetical protein
MYRQELNVFNFNDMYSVQYYLQVSAEASKFLSICSLQIAVEISF